MVRVWLEGAESVLRDGVWLARESVCIGTFMFCEAMVAMCIAPSLSFPIDRLCLLDVHTTLLMPGNEEHV